MISATMSGVERAKSGVRLRVSEIGGIMDRTVERLCRELAQRIEKKLSGEVLQVRTGHLKASVRVSIDREFLKVSGHVYVGDFKAKFFEFGVKHTVTRKEHMARRNGKDFKIRSHRVRINVPKRPFVQPSIEEMKPKAMLLDALRGAIATAMELAV